MKLEELKSWYEGLTKESLEHINSFYTEDGINKRLKEDGLSDYEAAFMRGYLE